MSKRSFIAGLASGLLLASLAAIAARLIWVQTRPFKHFGGGRHLDSPNAKYKAEAWNMEERSISGRERDFYSFRVTNNDTGFEICRYEFPMPKDPVWFRGGAGTIHWEQDSLVVLFGTPNEIVWSYTIRQTQP